MAYQPIQLGRIGWLSGADSLDNALGNAIRTWQQNQAQAAQNLRDAAGQKNTEFQQKRQQQGDFEDAVAKATALWKTDPKAAMAIMAPYGGQMGQRQEEAQSEWAPKLNQSEIDFADTLPRAPGGGFGSPAPGSAEASDAAEEGAIQQQLGGQSAFDKIRGAQQAQQQKQMQAVQFLTGRTPWGQEWNIDPSAAQRDNLQRADQAMYQASGDETDEAAQVREQYPQLRATYQAAGQDIDPKAVLTDFRADARIKASEAAATERERMRLEAEARRNAEWDRRFPLQEEGRDRRALLSAGNRSQMVEQGEKRIELSTEAAAREATRAVLSNLGAKEEILADRKYSNMLANLTTNPNAALDAATSGQWVKLAQGGTGVISDSDMDTFWHKIGGAGAYVEGKAQDVINGQIANGKRQIVSEAVQWLAGRAQFNLANIQKSVEYQFDNSPNLKPYKDQMVGTYFPGYRARAQNRQAVKGGGAVDLSPYEAMMKGGGQ